MGRARFNPGAAVHRSGVYRGERRRRPGSQLVDRTTFQAPGRQGCRAADPALIQHSATAAVAKRAQLVSAYARERAGLTGPGSDGPGQVHSPASANKTALTPQIHLQSHTPPTHTYIPNLLQYVPATKTNFSRRASSDRKRNNFHHAQTKLTHFQQRNEGDAAYDWRAPTIKLNKSREIRRH